MGTNQRVDEDKAEDGKQALGDDMLPGPRERLQMLGEARLSDAECLALILRVGSRGENSEQVAQRLLRKFGGIERLAAAEVAEVAEQPGIGLAKASSIYAAFGLARRLVESRLTKGTAIQSGADVARVVAESSRRSRRESFFVLSLDGRHRLLSFRIVSIGSLQAAPVHPREVFGPAIREGAAAIVVAHNHPSGDPMPSAEDHAVTERLRQVGQLVGIAVLDHVVVGTSQFYSFADERLHVLP